MNGATETEWRRQEREGAMTPTDLGEFEQFGAPRHRICPIMASAVPSHFLLLPPFRCLAVLVLPFTTVARPVFCGRRPEAGRLVADEIPRYEARDLLLSRVDKNRSSLEVRKLSRKQAPTILDADGSGWGGLSRISVHPRQSASSAYPNVGVLSRRHQPICGKFSHSLALGMTVIAEGPRFVQ
jgi:hypothetical protein